MYYFTYISNSDTFASVLKHNSPLSLLLLSLLIGVYYFKAFIFDDFETLCSGGKGDPSDILLA